MLQQLRQRQIFPIHSTEVLYEMTKSSRNFLLAVIPLGVCAAYLFRDEIMKAFGSIPRCAFNLITGYYCPGCGNTRSLSCLLHGEFLKAVRNNPALPFFCFLLILFYSELICNAVGKKIRLVPRSGIFWWTIMILFFIFYILRNVFPVLAPIK